MEKEVKLFTEDVMKDMGKRIQSARKKKGYKAIDFADIIGIGKDQLSRIETGRVACKIDYLFVISQVLDVTTDYLLYGENVLNEESFIRQLVVKMEPRIRKKAIKLLEILSD